MENRQLSEQSKNEIVVYQPNETIRLEVRLADETVWLNQLQLCELFGIVKSNVSYHLRNIFSCGELDRLATVQKIRTVQNEGGREVVRLVEFFNLDVIISLGFRVNSKLGIQFRQWANSVLKEYMLQGLAVARRCDALALEMDRRLSRHDREIVDLRRDVDYFISSSLPPKEKVFVDGKMLDAQIELTRIVKTARHRIVLIDNYIDERTLMLLGNRRYGVACTVYTCGANSPKLAPAVANYNKEFPLMPILIKNYKKSHDRFLVVDSIAWHVGASLKDAGSALFAMMRMELDPEVILALLPEEHRDDKEA